MRRLQDKGTRIKRVVPSDLQRSHEYIKQIDFLIRHQTGRVAAACSETEKCREKLEIATREEKKFERLEEIKKSEYDREMNLILQKETDEVASKSANAKRSTAIAL
jgi:flagellar export protein FliJ